ncbi:MAG: DUF362 domain-containing protein [Bryobacteraceae bacterium]|nr:DUF362 domain-containing protein [Bryobacteraceae bacterium]
MTQFTRRSWIAGGGALAGSLLLRKPLRGAGAPAAPVAVASCRSYGPELVSSLDRMFDQLGGLGRIVSGKTVAMKVNLTGLADARLGRLPCGLTHWTHPSVIGTVIHLMGRAGARRIRILESPWRSSEPIDEFLLAAGWEPRDFLNAARAVEFENTNYLGAGKRYVRFTTPHGGHVFRAFDLNHSYQDCDVFVSIAKLKEHLTTGVTLSMKNCFGITPCTIYGDGAGVDEPGLVPLGGRLPLHTGQRQPSKSAPPENDPSSPRDGGYRVPRIVADLVAARPIDLAIIDGIRTQTKGETPGVEGAIPVAPGVLIAGTNCVSTDAVATAVMGFDPMADRGRAPFENCDSTLRLAEELGVGTRDLSRIEVIGAPIAQVRFDFREPPHAKDAA